MITMKPYLFEADMPGYTLFNDDDGVTSGPFWWKDCATSGCGNQVCTWLSNSLCHPCVTKSAARSAGKEIHYVEGQ